MMCSEIRSVLGALAGACRDVWGWEIVEQDLDDGNGVSSMGSVLGIS
jgi:hypothetical protein